MEERDKVEVSMPDLGLSAQQVSRLESKFASLIVDELPEGTVEHGKIKSKVKIKIKDKSKG
jgi:hypothetical protein